MAGFVFFVACWMQLSVNLLTEIVCGCDSVSVSECAHLQQSVDIGLMSLCAMAQVDLVQCDICGLGGQPRLAADTVIMNPPFGTRRKGADLDFLRAAFRVSRMP